MDYNSKNMKVKAKDKFEFTNPNNASEKIKFIITALDYDNDTASVRIYYPEINDTVFKISELDICKKI